MYQCENILRFSNNITYETDILDYNIFMPTSLLLDYSHIIVDVLWCGEIAAVLCIDKVIFINADLKIIRSESIQGYCVQGIWLGYSLVITTKVDVQYVNLQGHILQLYCLENY